jgi:hypothetical protein
MLWQQINSTIVAFPFFRAPPVILNFFLPLPSPILYHCQTTVFSKERSCDKNENKPGHHPRTALNNVSLAVESDSVTRVILMFSEHDG